MFDLPLLKDTVTNFDNLPENVQTARQQLLAKVYKKQVFNPDVMYDMMPMRMPMAKAEAAGAMQPMAAAPAEAPIMPN